jgi:MFS family permease
MGGCVAGENEAAPGAPQAGRLRLQYLHAFVSAACIGPFLSYVLSDAGWSPREIGYATAVFTASAVATAPLWGFLDDLLHGGAARLSLLCAALASVVLTVSVTRWGIGATLASVALMGCSSGSIEALLTSRALRDPRTAARLGATRALGSAGWVLGLGLGGVLLTLTSRSALVFLLAGLAALTAPRPAGGLAPAGPGRAGIGQARPPLRAVLGVLSITFPLPLCTAALVYFTAGWARQDLGAGPLVAVLPLAFSAALELPAFAAVDRLARRLAPRWLCALAFPPIGTAVLVLALLPGRGTLFAVQPLVAMSFTLWFVGQSRLLAERVPAHRLASGLTLVSTLGRGVAGPLAGTVGGAIAAAGGYPALFLSMAGVCLLGFLRALVAAWRPSRPSAQRQPAESGRAVSTSG